MSKYLSLSFLASLVVTVVGLVLGTHVLGSGLSTQALGIALVVLSDLGVQGLKPTAPTATTTGA